jgi:flagellin-like protein
LSSVIFSLERFKYSQMRLYNMFFGSKRGMSPLIATVLLIAFAVAMGAMIMNWSSDIESSPKDNTNYCKSVSISSSQGACFQNNAVSFRAVNDGSRKVDGVLINFDSDISSFDMTLKDSSLIQSETIDKTVPYIHNGGAITLTFVPLIVEEGEIIECRIQGFSQNDLPNC